MLSLLSLHANQVAIRVPEMECQAQLMAQGTIARGQVARKKRVARLVARPAFCIPTSMEMVRFFALLKWKSLPVT
jgi:hypothetical protein